MYSEIDSKYLYLEYCLLPVIYRPGHEMSLLEPKARAPSPSRLETMVTQARDRLEPGAEKLELRLEPGTTFDRLNPAKLIGVLVW